MRLTVEERQVERFQTLVFDQGAAAWAIVLPGAGYSAQGPLLWYARRAALQSGRNVLVVTDMFTRERDDPVQWVEERVKATLSHVRAQDARPLLIAKSLTSLAAPLAAEGRLPAVWFTPLIAESSVADRVVAGLRAGTEPRLIIGGDDDSTWDSSVARTLANTEVVELAGSDHSLEVPDDVPKSLENLKRATEAVSQFIARLMS